MSRPLAVRPSSSQQAVPACSSAHLARRAARSRRGRCARSWSPRSCGFAVSLITGSIGLPMMFPCPVGKKWTTAPAAAISVMHSAAAEEVSMKYRPGRVGRLRRLENADNLAFCRSSGCCRAPSPRSSSGRRAMLPLVGCEPSRSTPCCVDHPRRSSSKVAMELRPGSPGSPSRSAHDVLAAGELRGLAEAGRCAPVVDQPLGERCRRSGWRRARWSCRTRRTSC